MVYDLVWNEPYSGDYNVVMRHICNIREKIEDDPGQPLYIQTVVLCQDLVQVKMRNFSPF